MSRLQCLGKSSTGSQKQLASQVITFAHAETHTPSDKVGEKTVNDKLGTLQALALPRSAQVPCKETQKSGFQSGAALNTGVEYTPKKSMNKTQREEEQAQSTAVHGEEPKMKDLRKALHPDSAGTGGTTHTPPAVEPLPTHGVEWQAEDEDIKTPVTLKMKFLMAVMGRNLQLASKLCQMILIYEPHNPEASEFLPLIKKRLLEEQEAEQSEEDDDSSCSSSSCSSSSPSDDEAEEKPGTKHKPCPPCKVCP